MENHTLTIYTASPRGFCAGVTRAVQTAEQALQTHRSIYIRREIVHNRIIVQRLEAKGATFVDKLEDIPLRSANGRQQVVLFSAHGVAPQIRRQADQLEFEVIDATCPLVNLVHQRVRKYSNQGYQIIYIGHAGHDEVEGVLGESSTIWLVQNANDVRKLPPEPDQPLIWLSQTTLSVEETSQIVQELHVRYPNLQDPDKSSICYATTNRQLAVRGLIEQLGQHQRPAIIVVGSANSSNTQRLVEIAQQKMSETDTYNVDQLNELDLDTLVQYDAIGITSGASVPDDLVTEIVHALGINASFSSEVQIKELQFVDEQMVFNIVH